MTRTKMIPIVLLALAAGMEAEAGTTTQCVTIYLERTGLVDSYALRTAEETAALVYGEIGVSLEWIHSTRDSVGEACAPIDIRFHWDLPAKFHTSALGYASPYADGGTQVHVAVSRVPRFPAAKQRGAFLGYVMAHEIGHVLERIDRHSKEGVMKAVWTNQDMPEILGRSLRFAPEDVRLIHRGLASKVEIVSAVVPFASGH